jgi:hypothetical protein
MTTCGGASDLFDSGGSAGFLEAKTCKTMQKPQKIEKNGTNPQENCGNRGFLVDFARPKVAL